VRIKLGEFLNWLKSLFRKQKKENLIGEVSNQNTFWIPLGSESLCNWCKKDYQCVFWKSESIDVSLHGVPVKIKPADLKNFSVLRNCTNFRLDKKRVPFQYKDWEIRVRF